MAHQQVNGELSTFSVDLKHVTHRYQKKIAINDVSLQLKTGTSIGLIGPDGVGKSTLLALIAGVKVIQDGQVVVLNEDMRLKSSRQLNSRKIAFMPQGLGKNLYPTLSVYENIDFFARLFGLDAQERATRIERLLEATGLAPFPDRPAGKLSGGMKQKLSLCCALVYDPELLILDEPTTGVDPLSRSQFWDLVESLRQERPDMTVVVSTAYIDEAQNFEYLLAMDDGKLLAHDLTKNVLKDTHSQSLEEAYMKLLPVDKRGNMDGLNIPPFVPEPNQPYAITAHNLTKKFGNFTAVDNVNFEIEKGEIFGFLGSNGCGKSTTMKMLTGLLDASSGSAKLLGQVIDPKDMQTRMRVGYMSQSFSLYEELSVYQNLVLHAKLYQIPASEQANLIKTALHDFDLSDVAQQMPSSLSLGMRQRLQLAAACLHGPEVLILDEPTSGVDPAARDMFWAHLIDLSRQKRVTIFVSTHFMNEAERCDRISFMHRGRVLAVGTPDALQENKHAKTLEAAFIAYLQEEIAREPDQIPKPNAKAIRQESEAELRFERSSLFSWFKMVASFSAREAKELMRDKIRLAFAIIGPIILLIMAALNVSFDVSDVKFTYLDRDQSVLSRQFIEEFSGSRYFQAMPELTSETQINPSLQASTVKLVIEIPPNFGADLLGNRQPEVAFYIDGAQPFTAENVRGFVTGIMLQYTQNLVKKSGLPVASSGLPASLEPRFVYNQSFKSIYAITPGVLMLALILIPTMLTALGVVREKEIGSIINLYASPASSAQYLIGKQIPYIVLGFVSYLSLVFLCVFLLQVPIKGSFWAMSLGALLFIMCATGLGLLISTLVKSQVAALFGSAIICLIPSINFSGLLYPVSTLTGSGLIVGLGFPSSWFQLISLGAFTKALSFGSFINMYMALSAFALAYLLLACVLLKKQES